MTTDWNPLLRDEFSKPYWVDLQAFIAEERAEHSVYPPHDEVFAALRLTQHSDTKVMVLGQDPYHGAGQAHGLAFSVRRRATAHRDRIATPLTVQRTQRLLRQQAVQPGQRCIDRCGPRADRLASRRLG